MSVGGTSKTFKPGLMTRVDWGCAASAMVDVQKEEEFFQRRRRRRRRLFRLDGAGRRVAGFLYHPPPPRWGRCRDKHCIHSNSGKRFTLAANQPPY